MRNIKNNCRQATMLIEKKQMEGITLIQNLELAVHLSGCRECKIYKDQSNQLNELFRSIFLHPPTSAICLDHPAKEQLQQLINDELGNK